MFEARRPSPARLLGAVYLLYFVTAVWGGLLVKGLAVHGNAVETAGNFAAHEVAVRASSAMGLVSVGLYLALTVLLQELLCPVSRRLARLATLFSVTACALQAMGEVLLAPLQASALRQGGMGAGEWGSVAASCLAMHAQALAASLTLFGGFDVLIGILIVRSGFLPKIFGVLMMVAGLGWLTYLWPPVANKIAGVVQPVGFLAEAVLMVWLLAKGVDEERWLKARRGAGPAAVD